MGWQDLFKGAGEGAGTGFSMGGPWGAAIGGGLGFLGGLFGKPKPKDYNIYGMNNKNREGLSQDAFNQLHGIYGSDPGTFWGQGFQDWSKRSQIDSMMPQGGLSWNDLIGQGNGADGRSYGSGGGHVSGGGYSARHAALGLGINDPTYSFEMPKTEEERLLAKANEEGAAMRDDSWRRTLDEFTRGGTAGDSPAAMALKAQYERNFQKNTADTLQGTRSDWFGDTRGLRNSWNSLATQNNEFNAGQDNQARALRAQLSHSASAANAQMEMARYLADAQRRAEGSQMLMGMWDKNQDRDMGRYDWLNQANMGWQKPIGQKSLQPGGAAYGMAGAGAGMDMWSQLMNIFNKKKGGGGMGMGDFLNTSGSGNDLFRDIMASF